ncbi:unnamed protein product [Adineta steineri]|uniref:Uncharacterized protein n=2 Tax=Adineta steineri TaxID=433720 RepID=A0A815Q361_9BILA|nr:unnamed protein product [Adineta steineri]
MNNDNQLITHLAAKALIQEITHAKDLHAGSQQTRFQQVKEDDNKKRLIDISLKYNILCPHTAFIGIETRTDPSAKSTNSNMVLREIPIEISADDKVMNTLSSGFGAFGSSSNSLSSPNTSFNSQLPTMFHVLPASFLPSSHCMYPINPSSYQCQYYSAGPISYQQQKQQQQASFSYGASNRYSESIRTSSSTAQDYPLPPRRIRIRFNESIRYQSNSLPLPYTNSIVTNPSSSFVITEEKTWPSNDEDVVRHLISLQKFDGLWNLSGSEVQNLSKKPLTSFQSNISNDSSILSTIIVIIIFETKFDSSKTLWSFMVNKARKRLTELLDNNGKLEQLINEIKSQL